MKCVFPLLSSQLTALLCVSSALVLDPDCKLPFLTGLNLEHYKLVL